MDLLCKLRRGEVIRSLAFDDRSHLLVLMEERKNCLINIIRGKRMKNWKVMSQACCVGTGNKEKELIIAHMLFHALCVPSKLLQT